MFDQNRHQRRAAAAIRRRGVAESRSPSLGQIVTVARRRAAVRPYDGRDTAANRATINACRYLYRITPEISARIIYTRDIGHHSGGWWKNPDYERCMHLSLSFCVNPTDAPLPFLREPGAIIARAFFGDHTPAAWIEGPYSPEGKRSDVWHYRLFCDPSWTPIRPRGEVYSRRNTPADWRSFSEVHGLGAHQIDALFLLNQ